METMSNISPQAVSKELSNYSFDDIESVVIKRILCNAGIRNVKNRDINEILQKDVHTGVEFWFQTRSITPDLELLEKLYELNVSEEDRKVNGSYYTPTHIVSYIIRGTVRKKGTICDPACGSGAFLIEAAKYLHQEFNISFERIYKDYLFGADILSSSLHRTKIILSLLAILHGEDKNFVFNLYQGDSLTLDWRKILHGFDYIVGNPPYVRTKNLRSEVRSKIKDWHTGSFGNVDLYIPFFELATSITNESGRVGFITPSTYLTAFNAKLLRGFLATNNLLERIVDFNGWQVFEGATTYTCITFLDKRCKNNLLEFALVDDQAKLHDIDSLVFNRVNKKTLSDAEWRLLSKKDAEKIFKIENAGSPLFQYVDRFVTGLATLSNDLFLVEDNSQSLLQKEYKGQIFTIERELTKKIIKPNRVKDVRALARNRERIIYPYMKTDGKIKIMSEDYLKSNFPSAYQYLCAVRGDLALRDKGQKKYDAWYAYGRTQGLNNFGEKIILPMMGNRPSFISVNDVDTLIYCGYAIYPKSKEDFQLLETILNSSLMWFYLKKTSKNYSGGFKSFAKNYVKNFSIPDFSEREKVQLYSLESQHEIDSFLEKKYQLV